MVFLNYALDAILIVILGFFGIAVLVFCLKLIYDKLTGRDKWGSGF